MGCSTSVPLDESTSKRTQFEEYTAEVDTEDDNNDNSDINIIRCSINKTRASMFDNPERARRFCEHYAFPEDGKQILAVLGAAFVYKGYDTRDRTPVAVFETSIDDAVTLEELRTDFEAQMAVRVDHPNILRCLGIGDDGNTFFAIMEYTNGGDLFQWLGSRDTFDECDARLIFYQVASAVEYLHSKDMLHGNVRPESLLLVADDNGINVSGQIRPKLGGFFLSEQLSLSKPNLPAPFVTELKYNSPEQIRSKGNYGLPSDIWSLGVILHVLLVGDVPFKAGMNDDDDVALKKAIKNEPLTMDEADGWADISESAKDLVAGMLEKVPAKRLTALQVLQHDWCLNLKKKLDGDGETPIHDASSNNTPDIIRILLDFGGDVMASNANGLTPLHIAAIEAMKPEIIQTLLNVGADKKAKE